MGECRIVSTCRVSARSISLRVVAAAARTASPLLLHPDARRQVARAARAKHGLLLEVPPLADALLDGLEVVDGRAHVEREDRVAVLVVRQVVVVDDVCGRAPFEASAMSLIKRGRER